MIKYILTLTFIFFANAMAWSADFNYIIEGEGQAQKGKFLVRVTATVKKPNVPDEYLVRCAVHGVLFKGFTSQEYRHKEKPMAGNAKAEQEHASYYSHFFSDKGMAKNFGIVTDGSRIITKNGKNYLVSAVISIDAENLKNQLHNDGIIEKLGDIF